MRVAWMQVSMPDASMSAWTPAAMQDAMQDVMPAAMQDVMPAAMQDVTPVAMQDVTPVAMQVGTPVVMQDRASAPPRARPDDALAAPPHTTAHVRRQGPGPRPRSPA